MSESGAAAEAEGNESDEQNDALPSQGTLNVTMGMSQGSTVPDHGVLPQQMNGFQFPGAQWCPVMQSQQGMILAPAASVHNQHIQQNNNFPNSSSLNGFSPTFAFGSRPAPTML